MQLLRTICFVLFISTFIVACGTSQKQRANSGDIDVEEISVTGVAGEVTASGLGADSATESANLGVIEIEGGSSVISLPETIVYFGYDSSDLGEQSKAVVLENARYLLNTNATVVLEGHTDERGTREYNLALGEQRAETVSDYLQTLGITGDRIQIVSYGEERPAVLGSDEAAWRQNRRVEILYQ